MPPAPRLAAPSFACSGSPWTPLAVDILHAPAAQGLAAQAASPRTRPSRTPWHAWAVSAGWGPSLGSAPQSRRQGRARWFCGIPALRPPQQPRQVTLSAAACVTLGVCSSLSCGPSDGCETPARCRFNLHSLATGVKHHLLLEWLRSPPFAHFPAGLFGFFLLIGSSRYLYVVFYFVFTCLELTLKYALAFTQRDRRCCPSAPVTRRCPPPATERAHGRPTVWVRIAHRGDRQGKALPWSFLTTFLAVLGICSAKSTSESHCPGPSRTPVGLGL